MTQSTTVPTIRVEAQPARKKFKFIAGGILVALAVVYLTYTSFMTNAAYFLTIDELYAKGAAIEQQTVRVTGMVDAETIDFNNRELILQFEITSPTGERLPVIFNGPKPDQMREGAEAIVEGRYDGNNFTATSLLLKCPSRYDENTIEKIEVEAIR